MNIFWLDSNLKKCAQAHYDKHVVKMPLEYAQLLSSALIHWGYDAPYKETHKNHPCAKWVRKHRGNYKLLWDLADELGKEYTRRYGKVHKSHKLLLDGEIPRDIDTGETMDIVTPLPNCTDIEEYPAHVNLVELYRIYYRTTKYHLYGYKNREEPEWMGDRFYQQQYGVTLGCLPAVGFSRKATSKAGVDKPKKLSKDDLVSQLGCASLKKLLVKDLEKLILAQPELVKLQFDLTVPDGRLKKPYIAEANKIHSDVDWGKLTVAELKEVLKLDWLS